MARGRRSDPALESFWRKHLADWNAGGQTIRDFCRRRQLRESAFYFWRRRLEQRDRRAARPAAAPAPTPAFVPVRVAAGPPLEVVVSSRVIRVAAGFDPAHLRAVVAALEGTPC